MKEYQLHKIPGVNKSVCTAEQMQAYNYAFFYKGLNISAPAAALQVLQKHKSDNRYNWAAVAHLLTMHLDKYRAAKYHIFTNYEQVAASFPVKIDN
jgi:hypothetical protein